MTKRLDRGVSDIKWRLGFPEASEEHLARQRSHHNPLLIRCNNPVSNIQNRPFWFQVAWCNHEDYSQLVSQAWHKGEAVVPRALRHVCKDFVKFNKEVFGSVLGRKKEIEGRLKGTLPFFMPTQSFIESGIVFMECLC